MPRFPPRGPHGRLFPRFNGTIKALRLPAAHPAAFRFLHLAVPREHASFRSRRRCVQQRRAWGWSPGIPAREFFRGNSRSSQVPGEPQFPFAHVLRPRPADASLTNCGTLAWPPLRERRRHRREDFRGSIAWLSGSPPTCHDVGYPSPRKTGFQALVKLSWTGFHPQSSYKRFSTHFMWVGLPFQASWHNPVSRLDGVCHRRRLDVPGEGRAESGGRFGCFGRGRELASGYVQYNLPNQYQQWAISLAGQVGCHERRPAVCHRQLGRRRQLAGAGRF